MSVRGETPVRTELTWCVWSNLLRKFSEQLEQVFRPIIPSAGQFRSFEPGSHVVWNEFAYI
jgi:hypothetical protein